MRQVEWERGGAEEELVINLKMTTHTDSDNVPNHGTECRQQTPAADIHPHFCLVKERVVPTKKTVNKTEMI